MALPLDLTKVSAADLYPEGTFRTRIISAVVRPEDKEIDPEDASVVGEFKDDGGKKYAILNIGLRYVEHPTNYTVDPTTGKEVTLVGRTRFEGISFHPSFVHNVRRLFDNAGVEPTEDEKALVDKEIDIVSKNKTRKDDGTLESRVVATRIATG